MSWRWCLISSVLPGSLFGATNDEGPYSEGWSLVGSYSSGMMTPWARSSSRISVKANRTSSRGICRAIRARPGKYVLMRWAYSGEVLSSAHLSNGI